MTTQYNNRTRGQKSVALCALGAAMFALGVSLSAVACQTTKPHAEKVETRADDRAPKRSEVVLTAATTQKKATTETVVTPSSLPTEPTPAPSKQQLVKGAPQVKRFVVATRIEEREPVVAAEFALGTSPIYAFAEFDNQAGSESQVRITFEKESSKTVGFVELEVPAGQPRWRTWGHTRLITEPGRWTAVLRTERGEELARAEFDVTS